MRHTGHLITGLQAGQYVFLSFPQVSLWEWHPFSLTCGPGDPTGQVHIRASGNFTRALVEHIRQCPERDVWVRVDGPYGRLPASIHTARTVLFVAGGIGMPSASASQLLRRARRHLARSLTLRAGLRNSVHLPIRCGSLLRRFLDQGSRRSSARSRTCWVASPRRSAGTAPAAWRWSGWCALGATSPGSRTSWPAS